MKINIPDSIKNKNVIINLLKSHGINIDKKAYITIIEKGMNIPDNGITIIFDPDNLDQLINLINIFNVPIIRNDKKFMIGRKKDNYELLKHDDIIYFESYGNFVFCQTQEKKIEVNKKLYEIEDDLSLKGFIRVNKSFVVNILNVIVYFALGVYACQKKWFENNYNPRIYPRIILFIASSIINIYLLFFLPG